MNRAERRRHERHARNGRAAPAWEPADDALAARHRYGALPLVGLRGTDGRGALVSWMP